MSEPEPRPGFTWDSVRAKFQEGQWGPELAWLAGVIALGIIDPGLRPAAYSPAPGAVLTCLVAAVAAFRRWPAAALILVWLAGIGQTSQHLPVSLAQIAVVPVAYGCARYGSKLTIAAAGLSMPIAAAVGLYYVNEGRWAVLDYRLADTISTLSYRSDTLTLLGAAALLILMVPWLLGLLMRAQARSKTAETARDTAQAKVATAHEVAQLREAQANLARDVHDVVGHSLAVILAQAESAQFFADDKERLQSTLATIATSARASLTDIRNVLDQTGKQLPGVADTAFADLVDGVRAAGREVTVTEVGGARALPPDLQVVAHRVVQEMLTNAVRHGESGSPIEVTRFWGETLCIQVRNRAAALDEPHRAGSGIDGMMRRLQAAGGTMTTAREGEYFVATAWMPTGGLR